MNLSSLKIASEVIDQYAKLRSGILKKYVFNFTDLALKYGNYYASESSKFVNLTNDITPRFQDLANKIKEINRHTSSNFNVFGLFSPGETMHSYIIAYLLNPLEAHGQDGLFLNVFLHKLGIENLNGQQNNWVVTSETGRIDILLKRTHPHSVVVIENKSNFAVDQPYQLYRYWYQEIYTPMKNRLVSSEIMLNPPMNNYQLIYLSPEHWKMPTNNSLQKPLGWDSSLPSTVPMKPIQYQFRHFIVDWLKESYILLPEENTRIKEFVKQYIEYWS